MILSRRKVKGHQNPLVTSKLGTIEMKPYLDDGWKAAAPTISTKKKKKNVLTYLSGNNTN